MSVGASYNAFDGIELIEGSIDSIRNDVDHISVVIQDKSSEGNPMSPDDIDLIRDLHKAGKIDKVLKFTPKTKLTAHTMEMSKRQLGYNTAKNNGCTHFISMDVDEYWEHLGLVWKYVEDEDYDGTYCRYINYYGDINHQMPLSPTAYVPAIYKITPNKKFVFGNSLTTKVICDPTRQMPCKNVGFIDDVVMHHMSYVRKDGASLRSKLENSSAKKNWSVSVTDEMVKYFNQWQAGMDGMKIVTSPKNPNHSRTKKIPLTTVDIEFETGS
jgi:hypothetical protein